MSDPRRGDRLPMTILFTDVVDSTVRAGELGDEAWRRILHSHHATVRRELKRHGGKEVDNAGDGFFMSFPSPALAIRCACAILDATRPLGIEVRAGIHVGEAVRVGDKLGGMGVHIGARIAALAGPSEVLVSGTVRDLVEGSGIGLEDRGTHPLKGVTGEWRVFSVRREGALAPSADLLPVVVDDRVRSRRRLLALAGVAIVGVTATVLLWPRAEAPAPGRSPDPSPAPPISALFRIDVAEHAVAETNHEELTVDLAVADGYLWIGERDAVGQWSLTRNRYVDHLPFDDGGLISPGPVAAGPEGVFFATAGPAGSALYRIIPGPEGDADLSAAIPLPDLAQDLVVGRDALWGTTATGPLLRIPVRGSGPVRTIPYPGAPVAITASGGRVYLADSEGQVVALDEATGKVVDRIEIGEPTSVAVGHGSVWVTSDEFGTGEDTSSLVRLDAQTLEIQQSILIPTGPDDVVVTDQAVWVGCVSGSLVRVDPGTNRQVGELIPIQPGARLLYLAATDEDVFVSVAVR